MNKLLIVLLLFAIIGVASGLTIYWNAEGDGASWNDGNNWIGGEKPGIMDMAIIQPPVPTYTKIYTSESVDNIRVGGISKGATLDIEASGSLTCNNLWTGYGSDTSVTSAGKVKINTGTWMGSTTGNSFLKIMNGLWETNYLYWNRVGKNHIQLDGGVLFCPEPDGLSFPNQSMDITRGYWYINACNNNTSGDYTDYIKWCVENTHTLSGYGFSDWDHLDCTYDITNTRTRVMAKYPTPVNLLKNSGFENRRNDASWDPADWNWLSNCGFSARLSNLPKKYGNWSLGNLPETASSYMSIYQTISDPISEDDIYEFSAWVFPLPNSGFTEGKLTILDYTGNIHLAESPMFSTLPDSVWSRITATVNISKLSDATRDAVIGHYPQARIEGLGGCFFIDNTCFVTKPLPKQFTSMITMKETNSTTTVSESGKIDSYSFALKEKPDSNVTITATPSRNGGDIDLGSGAGNPVSLTFSSTNYNRPQSIIVKAFDDAFSEGNEMVTIIHSISTNDPDYQITIPSINVTVFDNEGNQTRGMPLFMRDLIYWRYGWTASDTNLINSTKANVVHLRAAMPEYGYNPPLEVYSSMLLDGWRKEIDQLHSKNILVHGCLAGNYFKPNYFIINGYDPFDFYALDEIGKPGLLISGNCGTDVYDACYNNPGWMAYMRDITALYADIGYDGMWYDMMGYCDDIVMYCQCSYCKTAWKQYMTGLGKIPIPSLPTSINGKNILDPINQDFIRWRFNIWKEAWGNMFASLKKDYPCMVFTHNLGFRFSSMAPLTLYLLSETTLYDYAHIEEWENPCAPYSLMDSYLLGSSAGNGNPTVILQGIDKGGISTQRNEEAQCRVTLAEALACGGSYQWQDFGEGADYPSFFPEHHTEINSFAEANESYFVNVNSYANVGVVVSWWSEIYSNHKYAIPSFKWMGQLLLDMHVPFDYLIAERDLEFANADDLLSRYKTIILPDVVSMTDNQINVLHDYLYKGGKIIATYNTGLLDDKFQSRDRDVSPDLYSGLDKIAGRQITGFCQPGIDTPNRDDCTGNWIQIFGNGTFAYFTDRPDKNHWERKWERNTYNYSKPGSNTLKNPMPTELNGSNEILLKSIINNGLPVIQTDAKSTTKVLLKQQPENIQIHLINYDLTSDNTLLIDDMDINFILTIPTGKKVTNVFAISPDFSGSKNITGWVQSGNSLALILDNLECYTVIVIEFIQTL